MQVPCRSPLLALPPDVLRHVQVFVPVVDLLAFSAASRAALEHASEPQHWRGLLARLSCTKSQGEPEECTSSIDSSRGSRAVKWDGKEEMDYRATFLSKAEAQLRWQRGQPAVVRERRLAMGDGGMSRQRLQSMTVWKPRGLLLVAMGEELGVFDSNEAEQEQEQGTEEMEEGSAGAAASPSSCGLSPRRPLACLSAHEGSKITSVRATAFGVVTAGMDGRVKVLDWEGLGVREELDHHVSAVWGLDAEQGSASGGGGSGGAPILAASSFRRITVSDLRQPRHQQPAVAFQGHATWVRTLHMEMDRHLLVTGSADASCKVWDLRMPGQMQTKLVHPNHFEEVRSVMCPRGAPHHDPRVYTACYDGIVREFDLRTGRLRRPVADHAVYAVEAAQLDGGRLVSVDWSGIVSCAPTEPRGASGGEDAEALVYGVSCASSAAGGASTNDGDAVWTQFSSNSRCIGVDTDRFGTYRLQPGRDEKGRLNYQRMGPREDPPEVADAHMSSSVGCLALDGDRLLLGTTDGRIVSLLFRGGL